MGTGKPEPLAKARRRQKRQAVTARALCIATVFTRDGSRCRVCQVPVLPMRDALYAWQVGHVHEHPPRSLGGDPHDPDGCLLLCTECHMPGGVHGERPTIVWLEPDKRATGLVEFTFKTGRVVVSGPAQDQ